MFCSKTVLRPSVQKKLFRFKHHEPTSILIPHLDESVFENVKDGTMTPWKHPGRHGVGPLITMDDHMLDTVKTVLGDSKIKILLKDAEIYLNYIKARQPPATREEQLDKSAVCYWELYNKSKIDFSKLNPDEFKKQEAILKKKAHNLLKQRTYAWAPIEYTEYLGKQYLINRMVPEYAVLNKIFLEIANRCPNFKPHSLFDLCSGVGTVTLVARKYWEASIKEYYNVDSSGEMHNLARLILTHGDPNKSLPIKDVYYRQFLPSRIDRKYSITVCSYSLFEFPSREIRLQSLLKLWNKTEDFMIVVERGTAIGFQLILEVRDFILDTERNARNPVGVHIFSPCPHELDCPLLKTWNKSCRFVVPYEQLPIGRTRQILREYYSYIVFRRGKRPEDDPQWPRVLRRPLKKKHRVVCHLCVKDGKLCSYMFRKKKHTKTDYSFSKCVKPGDRLPFSFTRSDLEDFNDIDEDYATEVKIEDLEGYSDEEPEEKK